jgi:hypothetical protein
MLESGIRYHGTVQRHAGSTVLVATTDLSVSSGSGEDRSVERYPLPERARVDTSLVNRIAQLPGVRLAAADVAAPGQLAIGAGSPGYAVSTHSWSAAALTPFTLQAGGAPTTNGEAVVDAQLAATAKVRLGQQIRIAAASGTRTFRVSGIAAATGPAVDQSTVFVDDSEAEALAGHPGWAEVIGVVAEPGVDRTALANAVAATLPPTADRAVGAYPRVYAGPERGVVESPDVAHGREFVIAVSSVFGGATLLIAILVIAGTVGLSVKQRHRDIALLRAIAATPRQVRRLVIREAVVLGLLASITGVWALGESSVERPGIGVIRALLGAVTLAGGVVLSTVAMNARGDTAAGTAIGGGVHLRGGGGPVESGADPSLRGDLRRGAARLRGDRPARRRPPHLLGPSAFSRGQRARACRCPGRVPVVLADVPGARGGSAAARRPVGRPCGDTGRTRPSSRAASRHRAYRRRPGRDRSHAQHDVRQPGRCHRDGAGGRSDWPGPHHRLGRYQRYARRPARADDRRRYAHRAGTACPRRRRVPRVVRRRRACGASYRRDLPPRFGFRRADRAPRCA